MSTDEATRQIRDVLAQYGRLPVDAHSLDVTDDLFRAGLTSHASVNVMLGLEDAFDVEFPDALLQRATFASIGSIAAALASLQPVGSA